MLETLIISLCLGGYQCDTAIKAYYQGSQELKTYVHKHKTAIKSTVPKPLLNVAPLIAASVADQKARVRLNKNLTVQFNNEEAGLTYGFSF